MKDFLFISIIFLFFGIFKIFLFIPSIIFPHNWIYSKSHQQKCKIKDNSIKGKLRHWYRDFIDFGEDDFYSH